MKNGQSNLKVGDLLSALKEKEKTEKEKKSSKSEQIQAKKNKISMSLRDTEIVEVKQNKQLLLQHPFENLPYMFVMPKNPEIKASWLKEWSNLVLQWAKDNKIHKISVNNLKTQEIFRSRDAHVAPDSIDEIIKYMIENKLAKWVDKRKRDIRFLWISQEELVDAIYRWAWREGRTEIDVYNLIKASNEVWSGLDRNELYELLIEFVKTGKGNWLNKDKTIVEVFYR